MFQSKNTWILWVALGIVIILMFAKIRYSFTYPSSLRIESLIVVFVIFFLPPLVLTFFGWKLAKQIEHPYLRQLALSGVIAVIFTPYFDGHTPFPAILVFVFSFSGWALLSILAVWIIIFSLACGITWLRSERR
jgi:hypothetical protein